MSHSLASLRAAVEAFAAFALEAPPAPMRAGAWGVQETLSHLVAWHERYADILEARLEGREPVLPDTTLKAQNAEAVERFRHVPTAELTARLRAAQSRLEELDAHPGAASVGVRLSTTAKARPWSELAGLVASHIRRHEAALRA